MVWIYFPRIHEFGTTKNKMQRARRISASSAIVPSDNASGEKSKKHPTILAVDKIEIGSI